MIGKKLTISVLLFLIFLVTLYAIGKGWLGQAMEVAPVTQGPRVLEATILANSSNATTILFGDLHTHTNYSFDAYIFNTSLVKGNGIVTPADACDFARYCSALDFWSINDHAEGLTPKAWSDTVSAIQACNAQAGDPASPDMVSFLGWEWSNGSKDNVPSHYGHKNVIFRSEKKGEVPLRPIAAKEQNSFTKAPPIMIGILGLFEGFFDASDLGWYIEESKNTAICEKNLPSPELPLNCLEVASTPTDLFRKLDELGLDSLVIPHGLSWGNTNPLTGDFRNQLDEHEEKYQKLLEIYSGHGSSEIFENFSRTETNEFGELACPPATENFTPCCQRAAEITRDRCTNKQSSECDTEVQTAVKKFLKHRPPRGRKLFKDTTLNDWQGCGQLQNSFQPSSMYVPRLSAQYNLALGFDDKGQAKRARFGLIGSSDGHQGRPGSSYKETNRLLYTDHKDLGQKLLRLDLLKADKESGGFYYTGGLIAAHSKGRGRDAIWNALDSRNVYATSGDRMLVWFDLLNTPIGIAPMGSEVAMIQTPKFRVSALGAFEQLAGCPDSASNALGDNRIESLCGGECYNPGSRRKNITSIEVVRIRPQIHPDESVVSLIENQWKIFECPAQGDGCTIEFEDPDYEKNKRSTLYYARVIQESEPLIVGDPFGCDYNDKGECITRNYCIGENAAPNMNCLSEAEPRAWTSPIFVDYPKDRLQ
jgi:hypothetical protein